MNKQENTIIIRIGDDLKEKFKNRCDENFQTLSARIKALIKIDLERNLLKGDG